MQEFNFICVLRIEIDLELVLIGCKVAQAAEERSLLAADGGGDVKLKGELRVLRVANLMAVDEDRRRAVRSRAESQGC